MTCCYRRPRGAAAPAEPRVQYVPPRDRTRGSHTRNERNGSLLDTQLDFGVDTLREAVRHGCATHGKHRHDRVDPEHLVAAAGSPAHSPSRVLAFHSTARVLVAAAMQLSSGFIPAAYGPCSTSSIILCYILHLQHVPQALPVSSSIDNPDRRDHCLPSA